MSGTPQRIQRRREKGWTTPLCGCGCGKKARYVGRGTIYGNPFQTGGRTHFFRLGVWTPTLITGAESAVRLYRNWVNRDVRYNTGISPPTARELSSLRGHDLVCWCPLDSPCHADVLLEIANSEVPDG